MISHHFEYTGMGDGEEEKEREKERTFINIQASYAVSPCLWTDELSCRNTNH
ncbi:MAG: hypothetical protein HXS44_03835 [Theionarchaea archaeon]|nr:hypothetical protein [Theionarchaea archaeon]